MSCTLYSWLSILHCSWRGLVQSCTLWFCQHFTHLVKSRQYLWDTQIFVTCNIRRSILAACCLYVLTLLFLRWLTHTSYRRLSSTSLFFDCALHLLLGLQCIGCLGFFRYLLCPFVLEVCLVCNFVILCTVHIASFPWIVVWFCLLESVENRSFLGFGIRFCSPLSQYDRWNSLLVFSWLSQRYCFSCWNIICVFLG